MIFYIVAAVCVALTLWVIVTQVWLDDIAAESFVGKFLASLFLLALGGLISFMVLMGVYGLSTLNHGGKQETHSWELQQIVHDEAIEGRFYLGSGYINETQQYVGYYKDEGGYRMGTFPANKTLIVEKNGVNPSVMEYDEWASKWLVPEWLEIYDYRFVITVPEGSIAPATSLNLNGVQ